MANSYFRFKQFTVQQDACAMKVTTDACLFGAWCAQELTSLNPDLKTVLDIGTGTGLLALMLAQKHRSVIDAVEIDGEAAAQAQQNTKASPWNETITVHHADVLNMGILKRYDAIIANPPFYENELQSPDARRNTAHHSRQLPLQALIECIANRLENGGCFFLLLPFKRCDEASALLNPNGLFLHKQVIVRQTEQHAPFRIILKGGAAHMALETATITIATYMKQYTPEFTALLKDYYLYL